LAEGKQVRDPHLQDLGERRKARDGRGVHTALDQADELHRATDLYRKFCLRQLPRLAQVGDYLAKFLLKHGLGIPHLGEDGNGARLRVALNAITDGCATAVKMVSPNHWRFAIIVAVKSVTIAINDLFEFEANGKENSILLPKPLRGHSGVPRCLPTQTCSSCLFEFLVQSRLIRYVENNDQTPPHWSMVRLFL
jgi:hypothetical protein